MKLEALIAYLADKTVIRGKKALQKLVYFCTEIGVPVYASFRMHIYGPYSNEVAEELSEAITKEIIKLSYDGFSFTKGNTCQKYIDEHKQDIDAYRAKIDRVLDTFGKLSPLDLELYATVHFIATALQEAYGNVDEQKVIAEVYRAKGGKFTFSQIKQAYDNLITWGWLIKH
ncbi:hypothetical protein SAMN05660826_02227 [Caldanaerovirga acetigignens]|uniref:Antitoxin SocA-like Panacea domain-containing protein n=1 Tax=Caldanaerovirga acetigignens TaxID=447595 RepID=A0A1M7MAB8_9FIRM|nr:hypothetical protein [Caldanaerovirga acetigignens]SHM87749.1 hypothetical protein SAMN05660826_02227 [Caldanaerovirga acetigignens]